MPRRWTSCVVVVIITLGALAASSSPAAAQDGTQQSASQRCFEHHKFGAQPVDVAKTADRQTVLAQVSWGYHDAIGCYLTLDTEALVALQAAPAPQNLPDAETEASKQCFQHHQFGQRPVDVAKSADRQTVLARLSWGYHDAIGCYLTLDDEALAVLRANAAAPTQPAPDAFTTIVAYERSVCGLRGNGTIACWGATTYHYPGGQFPDGQYTALASNGIQACAIRTDGTIACLGNRQGWQGYAPPDGQFTHLVGEGTAGSGGDSPSGGVMCAIRTARTIACWGDSEFQELNNYPDGEFTDLGIHFAPFLGIGIGCGLKTDGTVACWGIIRDIDFTGSHELTTAPQGQTTTRLIRGNGFACDYVHSQEMEPGQELHDIDNNDGTVACWATTQDDGASTGRALGQFTDVVYTGGDGIVVCGLKTDGTVACWPTVACNLDTDGTVACEEVDYFSEWFNWFFGGDNPLNNLPAGFSWVGPSPAS